MSLTVFQFHVIHDMGRLVELVDAAWKRAPGPNECAGSRTIAVEFPTVERALAIQSELEAQAVGRGGPVAMAMGIPPSPPYCAAIWFVLAPSEAGGVVLSVTMTRNGGAE